MKKVLLLAMTTLLMCSLEGMAGATFYAKTVEGVQMRFEIVDEEAKICVVQGSVWYEKNPSVDKDTEGPLTIPAEANGYKVEAIMEGAFTYCKKLTSVYVPDGVTSIGDRAFQYCDGLESVHLGNDVTWLGEFCFSDCPKLATINFPNSLETIGRGCFEGAALTSLVFGDNLKEMGEVCFRECTSLTSVVFGKAPVVVTGFIDCTNLSSVDLGSATGIGDVAFSNCPSLTSLVIPKTVTEIDNNAFYEGNYLRYLSVEKGNPVYDSREDCNAVIETATNTLVIGSATTVIPTTVTTIGENAFNGSQLKSIVIPKGVTNVAYQAFTRCSHLQVVTVPESVVNMATYALTICPNLRSLSMYIEDPKAAGLDQWTVKGSVDNVVVYVKEDMRNAYEVINRGCTTKAYIKEMSDVEVTLDGDIMAFSNPYGIDFTTPIPGLKAYRVTKVNGSGQAVMEEVSSLVPAGEGLLLKGTAGTTYTIPYAHTAPAYMRNKLTGTLAEVAIGSDGSDYVFDGEKFVKTNETTLDEGAAYLHLDVATGAAAITLIDVKDVVTVKGDANDDGKVDADDVMALVNYLMGKSPAYFNEVAADVNNDSKIDVADIVELVNCLKK